MLLDLLSFRRVAALGVAAAGADGVFSAATPSLLDRQRLLSRLVPAALPSAARMLALVAGLALLVLAPRLWRGTRAAVSLAIAWLAVLAVLNIVKGLDYEESILDGCLLVLLAISRGAFPLGGRGRHRLAALGAALAAWALTWCAELARPLLSDRGRTISFAVHRTFGHVFRIALTHPRVDPSWLTAVELLTGCAMVASLLALRLWTAPAPDRGGHREDEHGLARSLVETYGRDSISPFILRPDKSLHFAADGVLAYRVIGGTAIVSGDPVAPEGREAEVIESFLELARRNGWRVAIWGSSAKHLGRYRELGLRFIRMGEEAFIDPAGFTLEGRRVRKLRQSVARVLRRGWQVEAHHGRDLDHELEREIDGVERTWRENQSHIHGFAMGMGSFEAARGPDDLYLLARCPDGELRAVMRFIHHCGNLSLDTMHRVGATPNGLNEALVCRALEIAREHGIPEVSLNYAGLGHLVRTGCRRRGAVRLLARALSAVASSRFQMAGLVQFDQKFSPEWRPRYLVFQSAAALPITALRVLQAEGYLPRGATRQREPGDDGGRVAASLGGGASA